MLFGHAFELKQKEKCNLLIVRKLQAEELSYADSNHDKQNQNLLCYHYTIGQSYKYDCL